MVSVLIFSFGPFGRAIALAAGASASTPNPLGFGIAWRGRSGGYDPCRRQTVQKKMKEGGASVRRSVSRPRRAWAWRGMVRCRNRPEAKRRVRLPRRLDAGPGGVRRLWGRLGSPRGGAPWHRLTAGCPTRVFPVRRAFCCFLAGFVVCRRSGRQTCRVGLVMVRGQFRFGHRSPWMAAATMAARLHSSSIASARIAASMARSSPIHHSM